MPRTQEWLFKSPCVTCHKFMHRYFSLYIYFFFFFSNFTSCVIETKPVFIYSHNQGKNSERKITFVLLSCSVSYWWNIVALLLHIHVHFLYCINARNEISWLFIYLFNMLQGLIILRWNQWKYCQWLQWAQIKVIYELCSKPKRKVTEGQVSSKGNWEDKGICRAYR